MKKPFYFYACPGDVTRRADSVVLFALRVMAMNCYYYQKQNWLKCRGCKGAKKYEVKEAGI